MTQVATAPSLPRKPVAARHLEAAGRARDLGVRVTVVRPGRHYVSASQSTPGTVHEVVRAGGAWSCTCPGFAYTGCCKHLGAVARRADREGWSFGTVARPAVAPAADVAEPWTLSVLTGAWGQPVYRVTYSGPGPVRRERRFSSESTARAEVQILNAAHRRERELLAA